MTGTPAPARIPNVHVIVVNYNGGDMTLECLDSVRKAGWPSEHLKVVLVDNASTDGVIERLRRERSAVEIIESDRNRGFAGGCNLALRDLRDADYVALLNNDAVVHPGWLRPLVEALQKDPSMGAACPKIIFGSEFVELAIDAPTSSSLGGHPRRLGVRVNGARRNGRPLRVQLVRGFGGVEFGSEGRTYQWSGANGVIHVPVDAELPTPEVELLLSADRYKEVVVTSGDRRTQLEVGPIATWYTCPLDGDQFRVLNSAGCAIVADGYGADRGFLERDRGQFDRPEEIFAWSGACVVLSRAYLDAVDHFDEEFFLYYEDFDLSWRGRLQGWRYAFVPESLVSHAHSSSTVEHSALFDYYVERNHLATVTRNGPPTLVLRALVRFVLVTLSYLRRDVLYPLRSVQRPRPEIVRRRQRALIGYLRIAPRVLRSRCRVRRRRHLSDEDLMSWIARGVGSNLDPTPNRRGELR